MIDVNDLAQIVRPISFAMRVILARPARRRLAARQNSCNRCEEIAPVEASRQALRLPVDVPAARGCGTALNQFEQAVAGADIPAAVGFENNGRPGSADPGIDNAEKYSSRRESPGIGCYQVGRRLGVADRRISEEVDDGYGWCQLVQHRFHLTRIGSLQTEIRKRHNHFVMLLVWRCVRALAIRYLSVRQA